ncbi:MAG: NUDIX domain-containing protein, partial [Pygmaiobacter sp.]
LMELGALICLPNGVPLCGVCPLRAICNAHKLHRELSFPVKDSKPLRRIEVRTVLVPVSHGRIGICKRPESGLLRGLWELPSTATALAQEEAAAAANSLMLVPTSMRAIGKAKHVFSHIEWHMTGYAVFCDPLPDCALHWVTPSDIAATYCLPSAFRAYSAQLEALAKEK